MDQDTVLRIPREAERLAVGGPLQCLDPPIWHHTFSCACPGRSATLNDAGRETLALAEEMMTLYARLSERGRAG